MLISRRRLIHLSAGSLLAGILPRPVLANAVMGNVQVETGPAFGSAWRAVFPKTAEVATARAQIETVVRRIDDLMSPFRQGSDLTRFNRGDGTPITVAPETRKVIEAALALAKESKGAFDPTAAPLARRFGFGVSGISADRPVGCYRDIVVSGGTVGSGRAGASLDLCGIAKGHALDDIVARLEGLDFLIELGGEIIARGRHPAGRSWRAGIERPGSNKLQRVIKSDERALATSGDSANGYRTTTHQYAHVVDTRDGQPLDNNVASVSVLAPTGLLADGLATAAMVLGPDQARRLLAAHDAAALFLMRDDTGRLSEIDVLGFVKGAGG